MLHAEGSSGNACCEEVHVLHTPNRGRFGWPSASILGAYKWRDGQFVSDGRAEDDDSQPIATLRLTSEAWMGGGARWTFLTHASKSPQYSAFASEPLEAYVRRGEPAPCPESVTSWKHWKTNRCATPTTPRPTSRPPTSILTRATSPHPRSYEQGRFMIRCGPVAPKFACCGRLRLLTAPQGGAFGLPSASILGQYTWEHGGYDCDGCDAPVSLEPVAEEFMGGTAWTFITRRNQYPVFAHQPKEASCPENVTRWKYWSAKEVRAQRANHAQRAARRRPPPT